jgi:arsenite methyltransferase
MRPEALRAVREVYDAVGEHGSRAPRGMDLDTGRALATALGYPPEDLDAVPEALLDAFVGAGPLAALTHSGPGQVVLDVGCGAGVDSFLAARTGARVLSLDASAPMLRRLRGAVTKQVYALDLLALRAEAPRLPVAGSVAHWVWLNGVANLVPDRPGLCTELARVTRSGGTLLLADVFALEPVPEELQELPEAWAWCVAGATSPEDWVQQLSAAGFRCVHFTSAEEFPPFSRGVLTATRN